MKQFRTTTVILMTVLVMLVSMIATVVICVYLSVERREPPMAMELQKLIQIQMNAHPDLIQQPQAQPAEQPLPTTQKWFFQNPNSNGRTLRSGWLKA